jgi:hypothetical protein
VREFDLARNLIWIIALVVSAPGQSAFAQGASNADSNQQVIAKSIWLTRFRVIARVPQSSRRGVNFKLLPAVTLYPVNGYRISEAVSIQDVRISVDKMRDLVGLDSSHSLGCFQKDGPKNFRELINGNSSLEKLCLIDMNDDGNFDRYAIIKSMSEGLIEFSGTIREAKILPHEIPYKKIDPEDIEDLPEILLEMPFYDSRQKQVVFDFSIRKYHNVIRASPDINIGYFRLTIPFEFGRFKVRYLGVEFLFHREESNKFLVGFTGSSEQAVVFVGAECCTSLSKIEKE